MFEFYVIICYEIQKLHMSSKQIFIGLTHVVYTKCENGYVFAKTEPQSILTTPLR